MRTKSLAELLAVPREEEQYLIGPELLPKGGLMAIYGRAGTGKSWLGIDMGFSVCEGLRWVGFPTIKSSVLIIQTEQTEPIYTERLVKYTQHLNGKQPTHLYFDNDLTLKLDGFVGLQALFQDIEERKPGIVILDCLYQMVSGSVSNQVDLNRFKDNIDKARQQFGTSFVILHHPRKAGRGSEDEDLGFEEMLTSSIFQNWLDTIIKVVGVPYNALNPTVLLLEFQKVKNARHQMHPIQIRFNRDTARFGLA